MARFDRLAPWGLFAALICGLGCAQDDSGAGPGEGPLNGVDPDVVVNDDLTGGSSCSRRTIGGTSMSRRPPPTPIRSS